MYNQIKTALNRN